MRFSKSDLEFTYEESVDSPKRKRVRVRLLHIPTGIVVVAAQHRSGLRNKAEALKMLQAAIVSSETATNRSARAMFEAGLQKLINKCAMDNFCATADFVLVQYLMGCLDTYVATSRLQKSLAVPTSGVEPKCWSPEKTGCVNHAACNRADGCIYRPISAVPARRRK